MSGDDAQPGLTEADRQKLAEWAENGGPNLRADPGEKVSLECENCGDPFEVSPSRSDRRFCSRECADEARSEKVSLECENCGDPFERPPSQAEGARFCSASCAHESGVGGRPPLEAQR